VSDTLVNPYKPANDGDRAPHASAGPGGVFEGRGGRGILAVKQAAERAGVSSALVYAWVADGLPHYRVGRKGRGGRIRIAEADLDAFLAGLKRGRSQKAPPPATKPPPLRLRHLRLPS
jgi:excisionase family DNA binding protein